MRITKRKVLKFFKNTKILVYLVTLLTIATAVICVVNDCNSDKVKINAVISNKEIITQKDKKTKTKTKYYNLFVNYTYDGETFENVMYESLIQDGTLNVGDVVNVKIDTNQPDVIIKNDISITWVICFFAVALTAFSLVLIFNKNLNHKYNRIRGG